MINKKIYNTLPVFKKSNKKYQTAGKVTLTDAQKKIIEDGNKKRLSDAANMEIEYTPGTAPSAKSTTTPVTTAPISNKKVVRLDDGSTNDYYEVDVDAAGKPKFNTKRQLTATQKKDYNSKYVFTEPTTTNVPTLAVPASVTPKIASTSTAREDRPSIRNNTSSEKKPQVVKPTVTTKKTIPYNTEVENFQFMYNYANRDKVGFIPLGEDGKIGPKTAEAMANVNMYPKELKDYVSKNSYLSNLIGVSTSNTTTSSADSSDIKRLTTTAKADSSKTTTDTSRNNAMLSDSLGVKPDTSATWQKPAPKKVVSIVPPSLNQSDNVYDNSEAATATRQEGKKDINKGDKLLKPQPDTWDAWIDRGQADIGAASMGASLTGVAAPVTKVVDGISTAVDAVQLAAAIRRGDVPEQWNQGIQVGARFLVPAAGRVAGSAIRKVMPEISGEVGKNIGKRFMNKVDNSMPYLGKETLAKSTQAAQTALKDRSENLASMTIKEAEDIMVNADAHPDKEFVERVAGHLQRLKWVKAHKLKKPTEMTMKEAEDIMINPENYPASYVKEIEKHLTETKSKLKLGYKAPTSLGYKAPTSVPTPKSSEPVLKPKISTKVRDQSSPDRYSLQKAQMSKPKPTIIVPSFASYEDMIAWLNKKW